ncbi:MAG: amidohydrolase family protein [Eubacteriales bacterium]|nr:amidohydrolase family protein [Eubacteriales bacterium]
MKIIDAHAHIVQYIAGMGGAGELRSIGDGMAVYANGQVVRMIPEQFGTDSVTPEQLLEVMDENHVEKAVLLQGNFYGFQNYYTYEAVKKYPNRFIGAASYDPYCAGVEGIRSYLFEELGFQIVKFEMSTGSGIMANHPDFRIDSERMMEAFAYADAHGHTVVVDIGKCGSASWQIEGLRKAVHAFPQTKFVACHLLAPSDKDEARLQEALKLLRADNLWFDLASVVHNCMPDQFPYPKARHYVSLALDLVGEDRLMFGTDIPSALKEDSYGNYVRWLQEMPGLTQKQKEKLFYENASGVFVS